VIFGVGMRVREIAGCRNDFKTSKERRGIVCFSQVARVRAVSGEVTLVSPATRQPNKVTCFNRIGPASSKCVCKIIYIYFSSQVQSSQNYIYINVYILHIYNLSKAKGGEGKANPPLAQERALTQHTKWGCQCGGRGTAQGKGGRG
jgi:hypothetical protein